MSDSRVDAIEDLRRRASASCAIKKFHEVYSGYF